MNTVITEQSTENVAVEAKMVDGIQEVTLSWGKLNYNPQVIIVKKDVPVRITADVNRLQGCFRSLLIQEFKVRKSFPERDNTIEFIPNKAGDFPFSCAMGMGTGTLRVV